MERAEDLLRRLASGCESSNFYDKWAYCSGLAKEAEELLSSTGELLSPKREIVDMVDGVVVGRFVVREDSRVQITVNEPFEFTVFDPVGYGV